MRLDGVRRLAVARRATRRRGHGQVETEHAQLVRVSLRVRVWVGVRVGVRVRVRVNVRVRVRVRVKG